MNDLISWLSMGHSDVRLVVWLCGFLLLLSFFQMFGGGKRA